MAVANRYARALADVVAATGDYRRILGELEDFAAAYRESDELREVFQTPAVPPLEKMRVLEAILAQQRAALVTRNFLRVVLANYRLGQLDEIVRAFLKIANARLGIVQVKILSATHLSATEQEALRQGFGELTRKQVELEFHLDAALLGGILAQIESTVYDGSVHGHLQRIRQRLMAR
jgi:F-type H+-transporting ATPase subunit delta